MFSGGFMVSVTRLLSTLSILAIVGVGSVATTIAQPMPKPAPKVTEARRVSETELVKQTFIQTGNPHIFALLAQMHLIMGPNPSAKQDACSTKFNPLITEAAIKVMSIESDYVREIETSRGLSEEELRLLERQYAELLECAGNALLHFIDEKRICQEKQASNTKK